MKARIRGTFAEAIDFVCQKLGYERAAEILGRSESLLRKWADPDGDSRPTVNQALELDFAYVLADKSSEAPIHEAYSAKLEAKLRESLQNEKAAEHAMGELCIAVGRLAAVADDYGVQKSNFDVLPSEERARLSVLIDEVQEHVHAVRDRIVGDDDS